MPHKSLKEQRVELSAFVRNMLLNRSDARGGYKQDGTPTTRKQSTAKHWNIDLAIQKHFEAEEQRHIVGLHAINPENNTCQWCVFDIDNHGGDEKAATANWKAVRIICDRLVEDVGVTPYVFDSDGKGGYHVWVIFDGPYPALNVYAMMRHTIAECGVKVDTFPSSDGSSGTDFRGGWVRLPGMRKCGHWMKVCDDGDTWLQLTADYLLNIEGDEPKLPDAIPAEVKASREGTEDDDLPATEDVVGLAINYAKQAAPAIEGRAGDETTFKVCAKLVRDYGLTVDQSLSVLMTHWNDRCSPPWTPEELTEKIQNAKRYGQNAQGSDVADDAMDGGINYIDGTTGVVPGENDTGPSKAPATRPYISNVDILGYDDDGKPEWGVKDIHEITNEILEGLNGWPKRLEGDQLFVEEAIVPGEIAPRFRFFKDAVQFTAWLKGVAELYWHSKLTAKEKGGGKGIRSLVKERELFEHLQQTLPAWKGISSLPHSPKHPGIYYPDIELPQNDDDALEEFVESLNPETELDRTLMVAALLTPLWGGAPGSRPAFVFTSEHGRGVGKTTTCEVFASLYGGCVSWHDKERQADFFKRLLGDDAMNKRVILKDNVKGRLDGMIEQTITSETIDGHRMYKGQFSRPNMFTWYITANTPSLSRDLAERAYIIRVGTHRHHKDWRAWAFEFIRERGPELLSSLLRILQSPSESKVTKFDRWKGWQIGVLSKLPEADEVIEAVIERRKIVDDDAAKSEDFDEVLVSELVETRGHRMDQRVVLRKEDLADIIESHGVLKSCSGHFAAKWVTERILDSGNKMRLSKNPHKGNFRTWIWTGDDADPAADTVVLNAKTTASGGQDWSR